MAAGRQAVRRGALHSADLLLGRAAELAGDRDELRAEAERALLDVLAAKGDAERALELGERLLADGDPGVRLVLAQVAADGGALGRGGGVPDRRARMTTTRRSAC